MRKSVFLCAILAITTGMQFFTGCKSKTGGNEAVTTDSVKFDSKDSLVDVKYCIEYVKTGPEALINSVNEYISEQLGDTYKGSMQSADSMINYYAKAEYDTMKSDQQAIGKVENEMHFCSIYKIKKAWETNKLITFSDEVYNYTGGAHGMSGNSGCTFRKSDGRRFGSEILKNTYDEGFTNLVKEGLKKYFSKATENKIESDDDLSDCLLDVKVYNIPMPQCPPFLTKEGVTFVYQQYEISAYAYGMPTFTIPYDKAKPYLIRAVRDLLN